MPSVEQELVTTPTSELPLTVPIKLQKKYLYVQVVCVYTLQQSNMQAYISEMIQNIQLMC
jgi:hypothetical protein